MTNDSFMRSAAHLINSNNIQSFDSAAEAAEDYGIVYNFSPIRHNVISWCGINGRILEIGGELGAVTSALVKLGKVTSVEQNREYAALLRKRCPEATVVGSLDEADGKFDYAVIIGSLEDYAGGNETAFLKRISDMLTDDGKLVIAADNSVAAGRLSGRAAETYTQKGYTRSELCGFIESAGLKRSQFLYPAPDYRFTNVIFSDELPPDSESIKRRLIYTPGEPVASFSESAFLRTIIEKEPASFPILADAFILLAAKNTAPKTPKLICYSIYRNPEYMISTVLDGEYAIKRAASERAHEHMKNIGRNIADISASGAEMLDTCEDLTVRSRICNGTTVDAAMLTAYKNGGIGALADIGNEFFDTVEKICGPGCKTDTIFDLFDVEISDELRERLHFVKLGYIDMIFQNCFIENGKKLFYDQEWMFENTPIEYIIFRAITNSETLCAEVRDNLFDVFGISEYTDLFNELNRAFSEKVYSVLYKKWYTVRYEPPKQLLDEAKERMKNKDRELSSANQKLAEANKEIESLNSQLTSIEERKLRSRCKRFLRSHPKLHAAAVCAFAPYNYIKCRRNMRRVSRLTLVNAYEQWMQYNCPTAEELDAQRKTEFALTPKFSILTPLYNTDERMLTEMIESVRAQTYPNWELCLADASDAKHAYVETAVRRIAETDARVKYVRLTENRGIAGNTNAAADIAEGDYIALLDHDDMLAPDALFEMVSEINAAPETDFLYTDEDKFSDDVNKRFDPNFKPDFSIYTLRSLNYICHFTALKKSLFDAVGRYHDNYNGAQDYDLFLRAGEAAQRVAHIARPLYHWRVHPGSTAASAGSKNYAEEAGRLAVESHLSRLGIDGKALSTDLPFRYRVKYPLTSKPLVSVLIPNKDSADDLKKCVNSVLDSDYENVEIVIVENNSVTPEISALYDELAADKRIQIARYTEHGFNYSRINNYGAQFAHGELLLLLNNDIESISRDWLSEMVSICLCDGVSAVGARLLYPDDTVQHSGVIIGLGGVAGHIEKFLPDKADGYFGYGRCIREMSAVTAACMLVKRKDFDAVGGFDETLAVAFNDIDLCMKLRENGGRIIYDPYAKMHHYESKSRGMEDNPEKIARFKSEIDRFNSKWQKVMEKGDPFFNKNLRLDSNEYLSRTEKVN